MFHAIVFRNSPDAVPAWPVDYARFRVDPMRTCRHMPDGPDLTARIGRGYNGGCHWPPVHFTRPLEGAEIQRACHDPEFI